MKHTVLSAGLMVLLGTASLGCKTAPKLAWWKKDKPAETTALVHSAPPLPSDVAKQVEGGKASPAQVAGGAAAPFTPDAATKTSKVASTAPSSYPSTTAPAFTPGAVNQVAGAPGLTTLQASSANLGSIAMPYNPGVPPVAKAAASTAASTMGDVERYASTTASGASAAPAYASSAVNQQMSSASGATTNAASGLTSGANNAIGNVANSISPYNPNRYTATMTSPAMAASTAPAYSAPATTAPSTTTPAATVASAQPYRPGGTSTYPTSGVGASVQVATRPDAPSVGSTTQPTTSPNMSSPAITMPASRY